LKVFGRSRQRQIFQIVAIVLARWFAGAIAGAAMQSAIAGAATQSALAEPRSVSPAQALAGEPSEIELLRKAFEQAKREANEAVEQLGIARAAKADCETTLGPLEAQARRADLERRWAELKMLMEKNRGGGVDCNPRTGDCTPKAELKKDVPK
jgi:hypothetical protein